MRLAVLWMRRAISPRLAMRSVRAIERFSAETGEPMVFHQTGSLKIARTPDDEAQLRRDVERGRRLGIDIEHISLSEARGLLPYFETDSVRAVSYTASGGISNTNCLSTDRLWRGSRNLRR